MAVRYGFQNLLTIKKFVVVGLCVCVLLKSGIKENSGTGADLRSTENYDASVATTNIKKNGGDSLIGVISLGGC